MKNIKKLKEGKKYFYGNKIILYIGVLKIDKTSRENGFYIPCSLTGRQTLLPVMCNAEQQGIFYF